MRPRPLIVAAVALAFAAPPAVTAAAAVTSGSRVIADCSHARLKPARIVVACGDGGEVIRGLKWSRWSATRATGAGTDYVNACKPDCASGHFTGYPAAVTLSKPQPCHGHAVFSRIVLAFTKQHPGPRRTETDALVCPP